MFGLEHPLLKINNNCNKYSSKKNVNRRSTSSHGNKEFGTRSMEKQRGMEFGLWKTTAVMKPDR